MHRSVAMLAFGALTGLLIGGYGLLGVKGARPRSVPGDAVALVNQRQILRTDFMVQVQAQYHTAFSETREEQRRRTLRDMIDEELKVQRGLEIGMPSIDQPVRDALVAAVELQVGAEVAARQPTAEELRSFYQLHKERYSSEGLMQLRDLLIKMDAAHSPAAAHATAAAAVAALRRAQPLPWVMQRYGLVDSGRFLDAGQVDLGDIYQFAVRAKLGDALYRAILPLKGGEVSEPLDADDGVHVVAVLRHRFPSAQSFEQAMDRVRADFTGAALARVRAANLAYLLGRADILITPDEAP